MHVWNTNFVQERLQKVYSQTTPFSTMSYKALQLTQGMCENISLHTELLSSMLHEYTHKHNVQIMQQYSADHEHYLVLHMY